jgi:hypothetical protein
MRSTIMMPFIALAVAASLALPAESQVRFGVRAGEYTDESEPFVGAELITPIAKRWFFNPNVEYVFVDRGTLVTFNGDFHYDFETGTKTMVWAGGGLAAVYEDRERSDTSLGANVIVGAGWRVGQIVPYAQIKGILGDRSDFVVMGGIRF